MTLPTSPFQLPNKPPQKEDQQADQQVDQPVEQPTKETEPVESVFQAEGLKLPAAPSTAQRPVANVAYRSIGQLDSAQLLTTDHSEWEHLEEIVDEIVEWVQDTLSENNRTEDVSAARRAGHNSDAYLAMTATLDRMVLTKVTPNRALNSRDKSYVVARVINEVLGLGPIEPLWHDPTITEIIVAGPNSTRVERQGKLTRVPGVKFRDSDHLLSLCRSILSPLNRNLDQANPLEDGRLPDKSRVNAVHPSVAPDGPLLTIRRHRKEIWTLKELAEMGSMTDDIAAELGWLVHSGCTSIVIGGTGSGKMLSHDTLLPTPEGMTTMGEVKVGDRLLDENGEPTTVTAKYSLKDPVPYKITFSDGSTVLADEDHNWFTSTRASRRSAAFAKTNQDTKATRLTKEELNHLERLANEESHQYITRKEILGLFDGKYEHMFSSFLANFAAAVEIRKDAAKVGLDEGRLRHAYPRKGIFNLLHAYGATKPRIQSKREIESVVTTKEIAQTLRTSTGHSNHAVSVVSQAIPYEERQLPEPPYELGVLLGGKRTSQAYSDQEQVSLPEEYLFSSIDQRKDFLAGFLSQAASLSPIHPSVKVSSPHKTLLEQVATLVASLGLNPSMNGIGSDKTHSFSVAAPTNILRRPKGDHVSPEAQEKEERFDSLLANMKEGALTRSTWRYITNVERVDSTIPMSCITVDSDKSLYLCTDRYIPTHNTTVLNAISGMIPAAESVVTIEDNLELQFHPDRDVRAMEARPASAGGRGAITIRNLVRNSLRMRPDRIVVGEVRGAEAFDMLQAMNTGHEGSLTTYHANGADEAVQRLESMVIQAGELDPSGVKALIAASVDLYVVVQRYEDGSRRLSGIYEIPSHLDDKNELHPIPLWEFVHDRTNEEGVVEGHYERINEISEFLIKKHRLNRKPRFTPEEVYRMGRLAIPEDELADEEALNLEPIS